MKADISIPNPLFRSAQQLAEKLGISLSDLYTAALAEDWDSPEEDEVWAYLQSDK